MTFIKQEFQAFTEELSVAELGEALREGLRGFGRLQSRGADNAVIY